MILYYHYDNIIKMILYINNIAQEEKTWIVYSNRSSILLLERGKKNERTYDTESVEKLWKAENYK